MRVPLGTSDFASYLLQAQGSGAQVLGLANAGTDFSNSLKAASEFGLTKTMKPAALLVFLSDIHAVGLDIAQGLVLTDRAGTGTSTTAPAPSPSASTTRSKRMPTFPQAAVYSATLTYLNAVKAAGTTDSDKVMDELHKMKINDAFTQNGVIRADGLLEHDMYIMEVKKPSESKGDWDYYKLLKTMKGEEAFGKLADFGLPAGQEVESRAGVTAGAVTLTPNAVPHAPPVHDPLSRKTLIEPGTTIPLSALRLLSVRAIQSRSCQFSATR